ncbi:MAG TPA: hypothetical protein VN326_18900 [Casimicrobiaceae bacterium]|jgi:hypothetical protein|nr:hypothetical protein [Casimicrobiaceae bacterium]
MTKETKWNLGYTLIALIGLLLAQARYQLDPHRCPVGSWRFGEGRFKLGR